MQALAKKCSKCQIVQDVAFFNKDKSRKDGFSHRCRKCDIEQSRRSRINNPMVTITGLMLKNARNRAKDKNLPFDLDREFLQSIAPSHCPVFGIPLQWSCFRSNKPGGLPDSPSLDRIDPSKGYTKDNVWIISHKANTIKSYASHEELKLVTEAVGRAIVNSLEW
jgi:hypothetical protein